MASEPTTAELLGRAIENRLLDVHGEIPAVVESYNQAAQTIDARIAVKRAIASDTEATRFEDMGIVRDVPVIFPRGGRNPDLNLAGFCITWPLCKGDPVRLIVDEIYAGQYRDTGVVPSEPGFVGRFNLSSCVALPGSGADKDALVAVQDDRMIIGVDGDPEVDSPAQIHITYGEAGATIRLGPNVTSRVALANLVAAKIQAIVDAINSVTPAPVSGPDAGEPGLLALQAALASFSATEVNIGADRVYGQ